MKSGFIAIIGRPNAGKSTLLNQVLNSPLSIVSHKAQTTRWNTQGILTEEKKGQMIFIDTPGIHRAKEKGMNEAMVQEAVRALDEPNAVWYLVDPHSSIEHEQTVIDTAFVGLSKDIPVALIMNKMDLNTPLGWAKSLAVALSRPVTIFNISALSGAGVPEVLDWSWNLLPEGPMYFDDPDQLSDRPLKFFVAEAIRGQLMDQLNDELPYSCAVQIEKMEENTKPIKIKASICVERDSQKGIVVGAKGAKIKAIGIKSREQIEKLVDGQVFLQLNVKVLKNWTKDSKALKQMGWNIQQSGRTS